MRVGNRVFFFINKALKNRTLLHKTGSISYHRIIGKIIKVYEPGKRLAAKDIERMFEVSPGSSKFNYFYNSPHRKKRAVMETKEGVCYLFMESMWTKKTHGDDRYVEVVPNSIDFLLGD